MYYYENLNAMTIVKLKSIGQPAKYSICILYYTQSNNRLNRRTVQEYCNRINQANRVQHKLFTNTQHLENEPYPVIGRDREKRIDRVFDSNIIILLVIENGSYCCH